ncbi:uncharacterized protein TNCV_1961591 [Trichonephila clavipes]|nr:uncharacterized protein TNCV_1961591 [Trichonephila clavipes]
MIPAYNKKRCAAFPFETGIHFRRKTDFLPEEDTTMSYSGFEPEPNRLQAKGHSHHTGWATFTCRNCGGGDRGHVTIYRPFGELRRAKIVLSPVWYSRRTTGVPLAHATMNFVGLDLTTSDRIVECGISVDGTWQRRGYSSMNGCVTALSVDTGKVVDIEIMSPYCSTCRNISKMPRSIESKTFAADHVCHSNFQGSALKMEAVGATRIFERSIVKRGLKYAHYYGDGDSIRALSVSKILMGRIAPQNMNALVMFKRE